MNDDDTALWTDWARDWLDGTGGAIANIMHARRCTYGIGHSAATAAYFCYQHSIFTASQAAQTASGAAVGRARICAIARRVLKKSERVRVAKTPKKR